MSMAVSSVGSAFAASQYSAVSAGAGDTTRSGDRREGGNARTVDKALSQEERQQVAELRQIDRKIRAHEAAHLAAAGGLATSGASYSYTYGPDGKRYATGGEVSVDTSAGRDPQANIEKGRRIQAAAMAPADPSPQDYQVARAGKALEAQGRADLAAEKRAEQSDGARRKVENTYAPAGEPSSGFSVYA
jgi:hypothetical protein